MGEIVLSLDAGFRPLGRSFSNRWNEQSQIDLVPFSSVLCHVFFGAEGSRALMDRKNVPRSDTHGRGTLETGTLICDSAVAVLDVFKAPKWALDLETRRSHKFGLFGQSQ